MIAATRQAPPHRECLELPCVECGDLGQAHSPFGDRRCLRPDARIGTFGTTASSLAQPLCPCPGFR